MYSNAGVGDSKGKWDRSVDRRTIRFGFRFDNFHSLGFPLHLSDVLVVFFWFLLSSLQIHMRVFFRYDLWGCDVSFFYGGFSLVQRRHFETAVAIAPASEVNAMNFIVSLLIFYFKYVRICFVMDLFCFIVICILLSFGVLGLLWISDCLCCHRCCWRYLLCSSFQEM